MSSTNDVDEIIETEVCSRLIRLSCAKMVNSKNERGGARLHRNLLILHLLRKARDEQKRSPSYTDGTEVLRESMFSRDVQDVAPPHSLPNMSEETVCRRGNYVAADDDDDDDYEEEEVEDEKIGSSTHLLDLSRSCSAVNIQEGETNVSHIGHSMFDYSSLHLAPLQYAFRDQETYVEEQVVTQQVYVDPFAPSNFILEQMTSGPLQPMVPSHERGLHFTTPKHCTVARPDVHSEEQDKEEEGGDQSSSSASEDEDDSNDPTDILNKDSAVVPQRHRRKRKTSAQRIPPECCAKKCCVEEHHLTGLISAFNSGFSVVADQLLPRPSSTALQEAPKEMHSFMHIAYNPLTCN